MKKQPTLEESKDWTRDMFYYFKERWEALVRTDGMEEVLEKNSMAAQLFVANEMEGKVRMWRKKMYLKTLLVWLNRL